MPLQQVNFPSTWRSGIDASLFFTPNEKSYFFKGNEYIRLSGVRTDQGYPRRLPGGWRGLPSDWAKGIDAAFYFDTRDKSYFFRGDEYVRLTGTRVDANYPQKISSGWKGLPYSFTLTTKNIRSFIAQSVLLNQRRF
jgi:hypothetical protein